MEKQWHSWEPINGLKGDYYIESISNNRKGFEITLLKENDNKNKVIIIFENSVLTFRKTSESFRLDFLGRLGQEYGVNFFANHNFFKISHSAYIQQFLEESENALDIASLIHFLIMDDDTIIDIIAGYEPKVELINE